MVCPRKSSGSLISFDRTLARMSSSSSLVTNQSIKFLHEIVKARVQLVNYTCSFFIELTPVLTRSCKIAQSCFKFTYCIPSTGTLLNRPATIRFSTIWYVSRYSCHDTIHDTICYITTKCLVSCSWVQKSVQLTCKPSLECYLTLLSMDCQFLGENRHA